MGRFSLSRRGRIWYVQFFNSKTNKYDPRISTRKTDKNTALLVVAQWQKTGIPQNRGKPRALDEIQGVSSIIQSIKSNTITPRDAEKIVSVLKEQNLVETAVIKRGRGSEKLIDFLSRFWSYEDSPYVREKKAYGHTIGRRHCYEMGLHIKNYWKDYFQDKRLCETRKADLKAFSLWLSEEKELRGKSINNVSGAGTVALRWAFNNELIASNPAAGLIKFSGEHRKRGILTRQEAGKLFSLKWDDPRSYIGNKLAAATGLRAGEILALQVRDIGADRLFVRHSWSNQDGLKCTKTGKERIVPLHITSLRRELLDLARMNPHGFGPTSFVFWSFVTADRPVDFHRLNDGLKEMLVKLNKAENWKLRNVVYHSWRHFFAFEMANQLEQRKVMLISGHKSGEVFRVYADHADEQIFMEVGSAALRTFGDIVGGAE